MQSQSVRRNSGQAAEVLARQGLRLQQVVLKRLRDAGIYCQPTVSIERENLTKKYVLRGVESGGASVMAAESRSVGGNGVHAIVGRQSCFAYKCSGLSGPTIS